MTESATVDFELLLELLSDEYACQLLCELDAGPKDATELFSDCKMSRPTVYRRLKRLTDAGIIDSRSTADGRQGTQYYLAVDTVEFTLHADGVAGSVCTDSTHQ